jgi:hypothetical protein
MLFIPTATIITPMPDLMDIREGFTAGANSEATRAAGQARAGDMSADLVVDTVGVLEAVALGAPRGEGGMVVAAGITE